MRMQPLISDEVQQERMRLMEVAKSGCNGLMRSINAMEWCTSYEKNGVKSWVSPQAEHEKEFRVMGTTTIRRSPHQVFSFLLDMKARPAWDKLLNEHKIADEFTKDANHRTFLWTMKFRPRYLKIKRRVSVFACYAGVHPQGEELGYMVSMLSVTTPLATVSDDEVPFAVPVSGYIAAPVPGDPGSCVLTYVLRATLQMQYLGFMERTMIRSIAQWGPLFIIIDRLNTLRSLIEEKSTVSVVSSFSVMRESNFPPQFLRDFAYIKADPVQTRDDLLQFYCGEWRDHDWVHVTTERGLVMKKYHGPMLHERHDLALKLTFPTSNYVPFSLCLSDTDKRLIWEPCATRVEHIWDDGPMNVCLKVIGGGSGKGRGCPNFEVFVYHIYMYGLRDSSEEVDFCVYEEHSDGNILLVLLTKGANSNTTSPASGFIDVIFFTNTAQYSERSRTSLSYLPASPLAPIERTLLESVIEFRNVVDLDTWLAGDSIGKLSVSDLAKSVKRSNDPFRTVEPSVVHKRKTHSSQEPTPNPNVGNTSPPPRDEESPLFGKVRSYFNKLPSFSSVFLPSQLTQPPPPPVTSTLHLLPSASPAVQHLDDTINHFPYEILVHIFLYLKVQDVRACSLVCHRWWQVANCDVVWRALISEERGERGDAADMWEKYAPLPNLSTTPTHLPHFNLPPNDLAFDLQMGMPYQQASASVYDVPNVNRRARTVNNLVDTSNVKMVNDESELVDGPSKRREDLKILLSAVQGYASPFKQEYLQGLATEKCWHHGVSSYVPCGILTGHEITCLSDSDQDNTILVGCKSGTVWGVGVADVASPTSRALFSFASSQQPVVQAQWRGESILSVFSNGEMIEYHTATKEEISRLSFTPMEGASFYRSSPTTTTSTAPTTLLASYLHNKLQVWNVDDGSRLLKWRSSRGDITQTQLAASRCAIVTSMHALYTVNMIDTSTASLLVCLSGHQDEITGVRILDDMANLVSSSSKDGTVRVWDLRSGVQIAKQYSHPVGVELNCFWTNPNKLITGLSSGEVWYWDPRYSAKPVSTFSLPPTAKRENMHITNVQVTQDCKRLLATWNTGLFSTWILFPR